MVVETAGVTTGDGVLRLEGSGPFEAEDSTLLVVSGSGQYGARPNECHPVTGAAGATGSTGVIGSVASSDSAELLLFCPAATSRSSLKGCDHESGRVTSVECPVRVVIRRSRLGSLAIVGKVTSRSCVDCSSACIASRAGCWFSWC